MSADSTMTCLASVFRSIGLNCVDDITTINDGWAHYALASPVVKGKFEKYNVRCQVYGYDDKRNHIELTLQAPSHDPELRSLLYSYAMHGSAYATTLVLQLDVFVAVFCGDRFHFYSSEGPSQVDVFYGANGRDIPASLVPISLEQFQSNSPPSQAVNQPLPASAPITPPIVSQPARIASPGYGEYAQVAGGRQVARMSPMPQPTSYKFPTVVDESQFPPLGSPLINPVRETTPPKPQVGPSRDTVRPINPAAPPFVPTPPMAQPSQVKVGKTPIRRVETDSISKLYQKNSAQRSNPQKPQSQAPIISTNHNVSAVPASQRGNSSNLTQQPSRVTFLESLDQTNVARPIIPMPDAPDNSEEDPPTVTPGGAENRETHESDTVVPIYTGSVPDFVANTLEWTSVGSHSKVEGIIGGKPLYTSLKNEYTEISNIADEIISRYPPLESVRDGIRVMPGTSPSYKIFGIWGYGPYTQGAERTHVGFSDRTEIALWDVSLGSTKIPTDKSASYYDVPRSISLYGKVAPTASHMVYSGKDKMTKAISNTNISDSYVPMLETTGSKGDNHIAMLTTAYMRLLSLKLITDGNGSASFRFNGAQSAGFIFPIAFNQPTPIQMITQGILAAPKVVPVMLPPGSNQNDLATMLFLIGMGSTTTRVSIGGNPITLTPVAQKYVPNQDIRVIPSNTRQVWRYQDDINYTYSMRYSEASNLLNRYVDFYGLAGQMETARALAMSILMDFDVADNIQYPPAAHYLDLNLWTLGRLSPIGKDMQIISFRERAAETLCLLGFLGQMMKELILDSLICMLEQEGIEPYSRIYSRGVAMIDQQILPHGISQLVMPTIETIVGKTFPQLKNSFSHGYEAISHAIIGDYPTREFKLSNFLINNINPSSDFSQVIVDKTIRDRVATATMKKLRDTKVLTYLTYNRNETWNSAILQYDIINIPISGEVGTYAKFPNHSVYGFKNMRSSPEIWYYEVSGITNATPDDDNLPIKSTIDYQEDIDLDNFSQSLLASDNGEAGIEDSLHMPIKHRNRRKLVRAEFPKPIKQIQQPELIGGGNSKTPQRLREDDAVKPVGSGQETKKDSYRPISWAEYNKEIQLSGYIVPSDTTSVRAARVKEILDKLPLYDTEDRKYIDECYPRGRDEDLKRAPITLGNLIPVLRRFKVSKDKKKQIVDWLPKHVGAKNSWAVNIILFVYLNTMTEGGYNYLVKNGLLGTEYKHWASKFGKFNDIIRNLWADRLYEFPTSDFVSSLYLAGFVGVSHLEADWPEEFAKRAKYQDDVMIANEAGVFTPVIEAELRQIIRSTLASEASIKRTRVVPFREFYQKRYSWIVRGSASGETNILKMHKELKSSLDEAGLDISYRTTKADVAEYVTADQILKVLDGPPIHVAKAHTKGKEFAKVRAIFGSWYVHFVIGSYITKYLEDKLVIRGASMNKDNATLLDEVIKRSDSCKRGRKIVCLDYKDFNAQHSSQVQRVLVEELARWAHSQSVQFSAEFRKFIQWYADSFENQWYKEPGKEGLWRQALATLFSGAKITTLVNTLLNASYREQFLRTAARCGSPIKSKAHYILGDDGWEEFETLEEARTYITVARASGMDINAIKQLVSMGRGEFLRLIYDESGCVRGCPARALTMFVNGNVESEVPSSGTQRVQEMYTSLCMLVRRGFSATNVNKLFLELAFHELDKERNHSGQDLLRFLYASKSDGGLGLLPIDGRIIVPPSKKTSTPNEDQEVSNADKVRDTLVELKVSKLFKASTDMCSTFEDEYGITWKHLGKNKAIAQLAAANVVSQNLKPVEAHQVADRAIKHVRKGVETPSSDAWLRVVNAFNIIGYKEIEQRYNEKFIADKHLLSQVALISRIIPYITEESVDKITKRVSVRTRLHEKQVRSTLLNIGKSKQDQIDYIPYSSLSDELQNLYSKWHSLLGIIDKPVNIPRMMGDLSVRLRY